MKKRTVVPSSIKIDGTNPNPELIKDIFSRCLQGEKHSATITYLTNYNFKKHTHTIQCIILNTDGSRLNYKNIRTTIQLDGESEYVSVDCTPYKRDHSIVGDHTILIVFGEEDKNIQFDDNN